MQRFWKSAFVFSLAISLSTASGCSPWTESNAPLPTQGKTEIAAAASSCKKKEVFPHSFGEYTVTLPSQVLVPDPRTDSKTGLSGYRSNEYAVVFNPESSTLDDFTSRVADQERRFNSKTTFLSRNPGTDGNWNTVHEAVFSSGNKVFTVAAGGPKGTILVVTSEDPTCVTLSLTAKK